MRTLLLWLAAGTLRSQWGRFSAAIVSVAVGVALALAIQLVNRSALEEFSSAMSSIQGVADLQVRSRQGMLPDEAWETLALDPDVAQASPVIDIDLTLEPRLQGGPPEDKSGLRRPRIRLLGLDTFRAAEINPGLLPVEGFVSVFEPGTVFLSPYTLQTLGLSVGDPLRLAGQDLRIAGRLRPDPDRNLLAMTDIANAQRLLREPGSAGALASGVLTRIDLRLLPGRSASLVRQRLNLANPLWMAVEPSDNLERMSGLSRAYRVNLNVLALVALVSGAFMVYATMSLAVRRQARQQALLAILGAPQNLGRSVALSQGLVVGIAGSTAGLVLGLALAWGVLERVGGDLGGGYFAGSRPRLHVEPLILAGLFAVGLAVSLLGSLVPALQLGRILPAEAIRYGFDRPLPPHASRFPMVLIALALLLAAALSQAPAWQGIPVAGYLAIGLMVLAGVMLVPAWLRLLSRALARHDFFQAQHTVYWLASQKLARMPGQSSAAVAGIVASLALASAMAIMVHSFRHSVDQWLATLLPADLYVRPDTQDSPGTAPLWGQAELEALRGTPGVGRLEGIRTLELNLSEKQAPVALIARDLDPAHPGRSLPFAAETPSSASLRAIAAAGRTPVFVSEAMTDLYGWRTGDLISLPLGTSVAGDKHFEIAGIWRDYVRQQGSVVVQRADYERLTGDRSANDALIWLAPGSPSEAVTQAMRTRLSPALLLVRSTRDIRALSLAMFDRSFALTYVLEAVAILGALFGVASTYSGEALARSREFGMLRHLGVTRKQVSQLFTIETSLMLLFAVLWALTLSLGIAWVLIHRINPQSFHWTMDTAIPWGALALSALVVFVLGVITAWFATRSATRQGPILAVREDW